MRKIVVFCLCTSLPLYGFSLSDLDSSLFYLQKAKLLKEARRVLEADKNFKKAIEFDTTLIEIRIEYGNFLMSERKYFKAFDEFKRVLYVNADHAVALQRMTEVTFMLRRWTDVIHYGNILAKNNKGERVNFMLGKAYYEEEDYGKSKKRLLQAIKEDPSSLESVTLLSKVYIELSDYKQAIELYNLALHKDANNFELIYQLGLLYYTINNEREAVKYFELAAEKGYKTDLDYKENLGLAYLGLDLQKGVDLLNKVLEKKPDNPEIMFQIAQAHFKSRNYQTAADTFYKVYMNDPTNTEALYMTGIAYNKKGDKNAGNLMCERAIKLDPKLAELKRLAHTF